MDKCPYCKSPMIVSRDPFYMEDSPNSPLIVDCEHMACTNCSFIGFAPQQIHALQSMVRAGKASF